MAYTSAYKKPYEGGWENRPAKTTPITAEIMDSYDTIIEALDKQMETTTAIYDDTAISLGRVADTAIGTASIAFGSGVEASGNYSQATGAGVKASTNYAHAEGMATAASGQASHAEGGNTKATGMYAHSEGMQTSAGNCAHAEGYSTTASADYAHAEGNNTKATGQYSHTEGISTAASNAASHAEGTTTTASGYASHAEGSGSKASEGSSHAEGSGTTASGSASHAEGSGTTASGSASHAEGLCTTASGNYQHVQGKFNEEDISKAFIVGGGTSPSSLKNILALDWNGNLDVTGDITDGDGNTLSGLKEMIATMGQLREIVDELPTEDIQTNVIYMVPKAPESAVAGDIYNEYINIDGTADGWEFIGTTAVDLSGYAKTEDIPTKTSELENDSNYLTLDNIKELSYDETMAILNETEEAV